jgi:hypothetical protein
MTMDRELRESGEVVDSKHLMEPGQATTVRFTDGAPTATDGPFAEIKESLAGYWIIECEYERAIEIASQVVGVTQFPMEVRRVMDEPPQQM